MCGGGNKVCGGGTRRGGGTRCLGRNKTWGKGNKVGPPPMRPLCDSFAPPPFSRLLRVLQINVGAAAGHLPERRVAVRGAGRHPAEPRGVRGGISVRLQTSCGEQWGGLGGGRGGAAFGGGSGMPGAALRCPVWSPDGAWCWRDAVKPKAAPPSIPVGNRGAQSSEPPSTMS